jgi:L,D-transpeptidase catalytic domain
MTERMEFALSLAASIGQRDALARLFNFAPYSKANYWAVVDFNKPSSENRLFIFDLREGVVRDYLVAHGKNSGEKFANHFSNENGSNCSSLGIYNTDEEYPGKHGRSLRIDGLEATNSNARERTVVIHKADYVVPNYNGTGRAGRSEGCFAVNPAVITEVIDQLTGGSYLIAWHETE